MPIIDRREIAFDAAAMVAVVENSQRTAWPLGLPDSVLRDVRFDPKTGQVALLYDAWEQPIALHSGALGALLVSYCLRAGIRIPRNLKRSMRIDQDAVVLIFSTSYPVSPTAVAPREVRPAPPPNVSRTPMVWGKEPK